MKQPRRFIAAAVGIFLGGFVGFGPASAQDVLKKNNAVPKLIGQADLDCSLFVLETIPKLRISAQVKAGEKALLSEGDLFYADPVPGTETFFEGSLWSILEWGPRVRGENPPGALGNVVFLRGRARVVRLESGRAVMEIVKACGMIMTGFSLSPYKQSNILTGPESEYRNALYREENPRSGRVVFMETDWTNITARGHWALIDAGAEVGLTPGTQMTVFRPEGEKAPRPVGNVVVVWTGGRWATVKILDSNDAILLGDLVQAGSI